MLLLFKKEDNFKTKSIIVGIWLYTFILFGSASFEIYLFSIGQVSVLKALFFLIVCIIAILLIFRSKIARFVVLINMYITLWVSLGFTLYALYLDPSLLYTLIQLMGIMIIVLIIYLFSNKKSQLMYAIDDIKKDIYWLLISSFIMLVVLVGIYSINNDLSRFF